MALSRRQRDVLAPRVRRKCFPCLARAPTRPGQSLACLTMSRSWGWTALETDVGRQPLALLCSSLFAAHALPCRPTEGSNSFMHLRVRASAIAPGWGGRPPFQLMGKKKRRSCRFDWGDVLCAWRHSDLQLGHNKYKNYMQIWSLHSCSIFVLDG